MSFIFEERRKVGSSRKYGIVYSKKRVSLTGVCGYLSYMHTLSWYSKTEIYLIAYTNYLIYISGVVCVISSVR